MTVSYSFSASKANFGGFARLLFRWKGSIYKGLFKEALIFSSTFVVLQCVLRHALDQEQKISCSRVIDFAKSLQDSNFIPFSFILGFYVSVVFQRWMSQGRVLPKPDSVFHLIASYVNGADERSRLIRRTLARYVLLLQFLTLQTVSTSVKRRFPKTEHLLRAGVMTEEEFSVYEKTDFSFGKWWLPVHWFTALSARARKEGRINEPRLLLMLNKEMLDFRNMCAMTIQYDLISVPLAYTQVATITTYLYALALLIGHQTIDAPEGPIFTADYYFPFFTIWRFFFCVGWLKVAQQILNPYGEDDDDFELNWMLDRAVNLAYMVVDQYHSMHPKVKKDAFWNEEEILLPQTAQSAKYMRNPELGSGFKLELLLLTGWQAMQFLPISQYQFLLPLPDYGRVDDVQYLPIEELYEMDCEENIYKSQSLRKKDTSRQNSSFIRRMFSSGISQSMRTKSQKVPTARFLSCKQGFTNPVFTANDGKIFANDAANICPETKKSSLKKLIKKNSPSNKANSVTIKSNSLSLSQKNSYSVEDPKTTETSHKVLQANESSSEGTYRHHESNREIEMNEGQQKNFELEEDFECTPEEHAVDEFMPVIMEETSRANSQASIEFRTASQKGNNRLAQQIDKAYDVVKEASEVQQELSAKANENKLRRTKDNKGKGYESCCNDDSSSSSSEESSGDSHEEKQNHQKNEQGKKEVALVIDDSLDQNGERYTQADIDC